jgi:hypothetical protein
MSLVKTVINPLRAGFVALTGNINDTFLATMRLNTADWGGIKNLWRAMNPGMLAATGLSLAAAFGVGYQIGTAISDAIVAGIEARRQAIIDSVSASTQAAIAVIKQSNSIRSAADAEAAAERTRQLIGIEEKTEKRLTDLSKKHIHGSDGFTGVRVRERGLDELEQAQLDDAKIKLLNLRKTLADLEDEQQRAASIAKTAAGDAQAAEQKRIAALVARLPELRALHEQQRFAALEAAKQVEALDVKIAGLQAKLAAVPAGAGKEETAQRLDLETQIAAATELRAKALEHVVKAQEKADAVAAKSDLYTLETQALQAEIAGEEQLARTLRRRIALLREIASTGDPAAAEARLAAQNALADRERQRAADAVRLDGQLNALADERAAIESNRFLTEAEKHARIIPLLEEENRLIAERTALLAGDTSPDASRETRSLGERAAGNTADAAQAQPLSLSQELAAGAASAADQLGSSAHMAAQAWGQAADSIRTSMGSALADMIWQTGFTKEALKKFGMSMVENFVQIGAQMVADWIFKHTVMAAWSALFRTKEVAQTAATEASKTGLTTAGEVARTSVKATSEVAKTAIVTASETTQTEVSVANSATRTAANTTEGMGWLAKAAVQAMNAVASIPYVGPILAIAAAAAIIGAGIKLLTGGFRKGGYTGDGPADEVAGPVHRGEYVIPASQVAAIGLENIPSMLAGGLSSALPQNSGDAPASSSRSHGAAGNQPIAISVWDNRRSAGQWLRRQSGRRLLAQTLKRTAWERGVAT